MPIAAGKSIVSIAALDSRCAAPAPTKARPGVLKVVAESDDASDAWIRRKARD